MKITAIKLKNIWGHADLDVTFGTGVIGIVGPNGSGKSTLVNSIYAALTNDFTRFGKVKADVISNTAQPKEKSFIQITGEHKGEEFKILRSLRPAKDELVIGEDTYTKALEITDVICKRLGVSKTIVDSYVFVEQWEMFQFLNQTPAKRAEAFMCHPCRGP